MNDFYTPKKVYGDLEFKTSNVAKSIEAKFFPRVRPRGGWSLPWTYKWRIVISLDMPWEDGNYLGGMHVRPTLSWIWVTTKSKRIGSGMVVRPTPPWTWRTAKSKRLGRG